jgi:predicted nucleotidyltransferase
MNEDTQEGREIISSNGPDIHEIVGLTGLPLYKVWNAYLYGSRVYGTNKKESDYDIMLVASSLDARKEIKHDKYNIHIITPDLFLDDLHDYKMVPLECIFAPDFARLKETRGYDFTIDKMALKKYVLTQSNNSWVKAKFKLNENDILRGIKSVFHSLRILDFGIQIAKRGHIYNFSHANHFWDEINDSNEIEWKYFHKKYISMKKKMEWRLKNE